MCASRAQETAAPVVFLDDILTVSPCNPRLEGDGLPGTVSEIQGTLLTPGWCHSRH
jgi:hypothetical protein